MIYEKLTALQNELKAPKNQYNSFGKYNYRNCEDICEAVKPLLAKHALSLFINDEVILVGDRFYVKATALLTDIEDKSFVQTSAIAREEAEKKGMDGSQVTGASSSYARKYCLNGLFLIDDTKDSDYTNTTEKTQKPAKVATNEATNKSDKMHEICDKFGIDFGKVLSYCFSTYKKNINAMTDEEFGGFVEAITKKYAQ